MDKSRDVRRGTTRFSQQQINNDNNKQQQQSRHNNIFFGSVADAGDFVKKEKIRRLSSVNGHRETETEMGCFCCCDLPSDNREVHQCPSHSQHTNSATNIFKIPKKLFSDCNVVNHASVPRKLRSAMKKRSRESISSPSPDSKKLGGVEMHRKDGLKKPKLNLKQGELDWSRKVTVSCPITKDEEEVVETLYALAGMFSDGDSLDKKKMKGEPIKVKSSALPETVESNGTSVEVKQEDTKTVCHPQAAGTVPPSTSDESENDATELDTLNETTTQDDKPDLQLPDRRSRHFEPEAEKSSCILSNSHVLSDFTLKTGRELKQHHMTNLFERKSGMAFGITAVENQMAQEYVVEENRKNGLALWQGLALGSWTPDSPKTCSFGSGSSTEKVSKVTMDRKSIKRCATHVYISCLIRNLEMRGKDGILPQPLQLKPHIGLKQTALSYPKDCSDLRNVINGNITSGNSATNRSVYDARNGILLPKMPHQEQPQVASASGNNNSKKQTFDFLSLSAGRITVEANTSSNKVGNAIESLSQLQVPYVHSYQQHQSVLPFSIPATRYTDHLSTAMQQVQLQLPQYSSNAFSVPPYMNHSGVTKQQQRLWAAHLAAPFKTGGISRVLTQFPSWQNGKSECSASMPCAQNAIPSFSTLDALCPKYNTVPQHRLPKIAISPSLPPTRVKRSDHLPSVYEESRFLPGGTLPFQLLCDEQLGSLN